MKRQPLCLTVAAVAASACFGPYAISQCEHGLLYGASEIPPIRGFGRDCALYEGQLAFGASGHDASGNGTGTAFVYERSRIAWEPSQQVWASDGEDEDAFGISIAVTRDAILIGTLWGANDRGVRCGAVYIFRRDQHGEWIETQKLSDPDLNEGAFYGWDVAMTDSVAVIGAPSYVDSHDRRIGAAYVCERAPSGQWVQTDLLLAADRAGGDFGNTLAIHRDTIVVGAPGDNPHGFASGSAYAFARDAGGGWTQTAKLIPSEGRTFQVFGWSAAVGNGVILIGAYGDRGAAPVAGAAYVFEPDGLGGWVQTQRIFAPDPDNSDFFGVAAALDGNLAIIGAENHNAGGENCGAAFVYSFEPGGEWVLSGTLTASHPSPNGEYGHVVAIRGNIALVAAPFKSRRDANGDLISQAGEVEVYAVGPDRDGDGEMDVCGCREAYGGLDGILGNPDLNNDRRVDSADLAILLANFGADRRRDPETSFPLHEHGDLTLDQDVDLEDLSLMLSAYGATCP